MGIKTFWIEPMGEISIALRRYSSESKCPNFRLGYHNAEVMIPERARTDPKASTSITDLESALLREKYKDQWPVICSCGYAFTDQDTRQLFAERIYKRMDTGELITLRDAPVGAMWDAWWYDRRDGYTGPDGLSLVVRTPDGYEWVIDGRASNCDMPCLHCGVPYKDHKHWEPEDNHHYEDLRKHKCWVRHGEPPVITVDKNGNTCGAGAGSIQTPGYHGFLQNGEFS
jgi:hypothetical protein